MLLVGRDLRQSVRRDLSSMLLGKTGSDELIKQRDHMVQSERITRRRAARLSVARGQSGGSVTLTLTEDEVAVSPVVVFDVVTVKMFTGDPSPL